METAVVTARDTLAGSAGSGGVLMERLSRERHDLESARAAQSPQGCSQRGDDTEVAKLLIESEVS